MDRRTRKLMTIHQALNPKSDVARIRLSRKQGGRGLISVKNTVSILGLERTNVTAYLNGYTGRICLRLNLYFQHIKKLLQNKKGNINITMYK